MDSHQSEVNWIHLYQNCHKSPGAGGYSREQLNQAAVLVGINPKDSSFSKKDNLCVEIRRKIDALGLGPTKSISTSEKLLPDYQPAQSSPNESIAQIFDQLAEIAKPTNVHRADALDRAAAKIRHYPSQLTLSDVTDKSKLQKSLNVGPTIVDRIEIILKTGTHPDLSTVSQPVVSPVGQYQQKETILSPEQQKAYDEITSIYGFGNEAAMAAINLGITGVADLINRINLGQVTVDEKQRIGLEYAVHFRERIPYNEVKRIGQYVLSVLSEIDSKARGEIVGSHRREKETSGDVDILITGPDLSVLGRLFDELVRRGFIIHKLTKGPASVRGTFWSTFPDSLNSNESPPGILTKIDIKIVPEESWATGLLHYTGSDDFNRKVRTYLKANGLSLSEYYISTADGSKRWYFDDEPAIFNSIGLDYVAPANR